MYLRRCHTATASKRLTQSERRARTHGALLEAAARGLSRRGYANLVLSQVARDAGYTSGALYHLFAGKEELALAVVEWVEETWWTEIGHLLTDDLDSLATLRAVARGHAVFCRRDVARVMMTLRVEFAGQDHPVGHAIEAAVTRLVTSCERLVEAARADGAIPAGPPARIVAGAYLGALEGLVISVAGEEPFDEQLAESCALGVLGLVTPSTSK